MNLFTYGSLMFPEVWERVTGSTARAARASLDGFAAWCVRDESYPGLVEARGASTAGVVYFDVSDDALARLDRFEGAFYRRIGVVVTLGDGAAAQAETYLVDDAFRMQLDPRPWSAEHFREHGLPAFLEKCAGWQA